MAIAQLKKQGRLKRIGPGQITYLLFMKRLNKLDKEQQSAAEFIKDSYTYSFEG